MAESLIDIKRRIISTKKTGQITSAMQMVSGAKLIKLEDKSKNYQIYAKKIREIVTHLAANKVLELAVMRQHAQSKTGTTEEDVLSLSNLLVERPVKKTGYLVITSDRGLVGGYNSNILRSVMDILSDHKDPNEYAVMAVGGMGAEFFKARDVQLAYEYRGVSDVPTFNEVREIVKTMVTMFDDGVFDELYVCYNHHVNSLSSAFRAEKMLPITDLDTDKVNDDAATEYLADPSVDVALNAILPQYAESLIFGAIMDAKTAEHASSMTAMKSATDNANDLIRDLSTQLNRARQAQITTEITEIVGGAAALE
ncbi:F0F1 ATP synthase subunit gamma [Lapidilactobacillus luobeiensis]|uniref:F0F1 ATP synthase subunit gamma n=1 Tax=Lapidilactobacillus luobeiensis TaxID=2950371 RepID=UPI0021C29947|nr:F0F1 ATP synthase subunit gamma [Lapidilactobacillus luobeiensis]